MCSRGEDAFQFGKCRTNVEAKILNACSYLNKRLKQHPANGQKQLLCAAHATEYTSERPVTGSVFPRSSIHPKLSCSLPESLDARVKSDPHKMHAQSYMYRRFKNLLLKDFRRSPSTMSTLYSKFPIMRILDYPNAWTSPCFRQQQEKDVLVAGVLLQEKAKQTISNACV